MCNPMNAYNDSAVLVRARDEGWKIEAQDNIVRFVPPREGNRSSAEDDRHAKEIARAAASVASKHFRWCYDGCK